MTIELVVITSVSLGVAALMGCLYGRARDRAKFLVHYLSIEQGRLMEVQKQLDAEKRKVEEVRFQFAKYRDEVEGRTTLPVAVGKPHCVVPLRRTDKQTSGRK